MLVATLSMVAVAVSAFSLSDAFVTATSSSPDNVITAGTLRMEISSTGQIVDGTGFVPGVTRQGEVTVTILNGHGELYLSTTTPTGDTGLSDILNVSVTEIDPGHVQLYYDDPIHELQDVDLGNFRAFDSALSDTPRSRTYRIEVHWPGPADDPSHQNTSMSFDFDWQMVSP